MRATDSDNFQLQFGINILPINSRTFSAVAFNLIRKWLPLNYMNESQPIVLIVQLRYL